MKTVMRLVPLALVEFFARLGGYLCGIVKPHGAYRIERIVRGRYWALRLGGAQLHIGRGVQLEGPNIELGTDVRLYDGSHYVTGSKGRIRIGSHTHIARMCVLSGLGGIEIGDHCAIAPQVTIYSSSTVTTVEQLGSVPAKHAPVRIGDNVYIGMGARILPGITIGDNAVIGAGAVVTRDVPAGHLAKGVPAAATPRALPSDRG